MQDGGGEWKEQRRGILQEMEGRLLWRPQSPLSRPWKKKRVTFFQREP